MESSEADSCDLATHRLAGCSPARLAPRGRASTIEGREIFDESNRLNLSCNTWFIPNGYPKIRLTPVPAKPGRRADTTAAVVEQNLLHYVGSGESPLPRLGGLATHRESHGR